MSQFDKRVRWCTISYTHQPHDTCDGTPYIGPPTRDPVELAKLLRGGSQNWPAVHSVIAYPEQLADVLEELAPRSAERQGLCSPCHTPHGCTLFGCKDRVPPVPVGETPRCEALRRAPAGALIGNWERLAVELEHELAEERESLAVANEEKQHLARKLEAAHSSVPTPSPEDYVRAGRVLGEAIGRESAASHEQRSDPWPQIVKKYGPLVGRAYKDYRGEYTFIGLIDPYDGDYYYALRRTDGALVLSSCVGRLEDSYEEVPAASAIQPRDPAWKEWNGGESPVTPSAKVEYRLRDGYTTVWIAMNLSWRHNGGPSDIVAYRVIDDGTEKR